MKTLNDNDKAKTKENDLGYRRRIFSNAYLSSLTYELALLFRAGISAADSMVMLAAGERDKAVADMLHTAADRLEVGLPFSEALAYTGAFPKYMLDMLSVGEASGRLESTLSSLSEYYDRRERLSRTVRSAVLYPCVLTVLMLTVAVILITNVLPVFNDISLQLGVEQSKAAQVLTDAGQFIASNILWLVPLVIAALAAAVLAVVGIYRRGPVGKSLAAARFASAMAMCMSSGLDTDKSLELASSLCADTYAGGKIAQSREAIQHGESFPDAIAVTGIFSDIYNRMLSIGFKTGAADTAMREIARRYEDLAAERTESAAGKLEPALVIFMALLVGFILLSVMLPLMSIMSTL
jgi:Type II secretory pathway, component PulF